MARGATHCSVRMPSTIRPRASAALRGLRTSRVANGLSGGKAPVRTWKNSVDPVSFSSTRVRLAISAALSLLIWTSRSTASRTC
jgi:hypothetical protein